MLNTSENPKLYGPSKLLDPLAVLANALFPTNIFTNLFVLNSLDFSLPFCFLSFVVILALTDALNSSFKAKLTDVEDATVAVLSAPALEPLLAPLPLKLITVPAGNTFS